MTKNLEQIKTKIKLEILDTTKFIKSQRQHKNLLKYSPQFWGTYKTWIHNMQE